MVIHRVITSWFFVISAFTMFFLSVSIVHSGDIDCWNEVGIKHGIDPLLLYAIADVESGLNPEAINENKNGSYDLGLMQINSVWFPKLETFGINRADLFDPCTNIDVGAWILKDSIDRLGYKWKSVGVYNVGTGKSLETKKRLEKYAYRVFRRYEYHKLRFK